ncbi:MAG: anion permease, partial [Planctomycetia bacterium]|nr:anion permease [Planctomycetia bacterium]
MSDTQSKLLKALICLVLAGSVFFLPFESWGLTLNPIEVRVIAMFVMAALFWILSPIPIWATSVLVITISLFGISNDSISWLKVDRYDKAALVAVVDQTVGQNVPAAVKESITKEVETALGKKTTL